jgi:hypothetical protein
MERAMATFDQESELLLARRTYGLLTLVAWSAAAWGNPATAAQTDDSTWTLGLSGEARERFESSRDPVFGLSPAGDDDYLLHRLLLTADASIQGFRAQVQIVSGLTSGWQGQPPATQDDSVDLLQGFVEQSFGVGDGDLLVRAGRQELSLGSSRLISVRESPNIRRAFDGVRASWSLHSGARVDAFALRPVSPERGGFDDRSASAQTFWGLYGTADVPGVEGLKADLYYLGLRREDAVFTQGRATELRHSVGSRLFGERDSTDWNIEGVWQWGSFGDASIRAWTLSADVGYRWADLPLSPRVGIKMDAISGDRNPADRRLETFNPLFPKLPYFSEANVATPANLLDVQPSFTFNVAPEATLSLSWNALWKQARADAFYAPPLSPVPGTAHSAGLAIGTQESLNLDWKLSKRLGLGAAYIRFDPRAVTRDAGGSSGSFVAVWVQMLVSSDSQR